MRALILHLDASGAIHETATLPGNYRSHANLICYGVVPYIRENWTMLPGDTIALSVRKTDVDPVSAEYLVQPPEKGWDDWLVKQFSSPFPPT